MGNYEQLKQAVSNVIKNNGNNEITGDILQNTLLSIISTVGGNATFAGIATPETNPGTSDQNVFYIASQNGTYSNFGGVTLENQVVIFSNANGSWAMADTGIATEQEIIYDVSARNNGAIFESLSALLSSSNLSTLIPTTVRFGGMSIRFIQGSVPNSNNKYVQYRLMTTSFSTNEADWQGVDDEPTVNSENLVKSGGVKHEISQLELRFKFVDSEFFVDFEKYPLYLGVINITYNNWANLGYGIYVPLSDFGTSESIKIKAKTPKSTTVAFVKSILDPFVGSAPIDYMDGYSAAIYLEEASNEIELPKPDGNGYLWVSIKNHVNKDISPEYIKCDLTKANYVQTDDDAIKNANESAKILGQTEFRNLYYTGTVKSAFYAYADFPNVGLLFNTNGEIDNSSYTEHYRTTDYIPVTNNNKICYTDLFPDAGTHCGLCLYNSNKELIAHLGSSNKNGNFAIVDLSSYAEVAYIRASVFRAVTTIEPWRAVVLVCSDDFELANSPIDDLNERMEDIGLTLHIGEGQQYTTLKAGFAAAIAKPNSTVYVHPGNYDLLQEFASEISAATGGVTGLRLGNGMKVIFYAGAYVTCLYQLSGNSTKDRWVYDSFNPMYASDGDYYIEGLNIRCSNTRYCVHDELGGRGTYIHTYKNCNMYYENNHSDINYVQCIGGGLGEHGTILIEGGVYESKTDYGFPTDDYANTPEKAQQTITYHNGNVETADSFITVKNVYLKNYGYFRFSGYGSSQISSKAVVCGCSMGRETLLRNEGGSTTATPFELTEFCCEVRNQEPNT